MPVDYQEIANRLVEIVKERAREFADANDESRAFLIDRAKRLAKLMVRMAKADEEERPGIRHDIAVVQQATENELARLAVHASIEARRTFEAVLGTIFDIAKKVTPVLLAAL